MNAVIATVTTSHAGIFTVHALVPTNSIVHTIATHVEIPIIGSKGYQELTLQLEAILCYSWGSSETYTISNEHECQHSIQHE